MPTSTRASARRLKAANWSGSMLVAILTAQRENVHGLADLFGLVEWTYFALLLWVLLAGAGKVSLDHVLFERRRAQRKSHGAGLSASAV